MMKSGRGIAAFLILLFLNVALLPDLARAQSLWIPRDREGSVMFEALLPGVEFVQNEDFQLASVHATADDARIHSDALCPGRSAAHADRRA